jgi:hypothetical protein
MGLRVPAIPLTKAVYAMTEEDLQQVMQRGQIMPRENKKKGKGKPAIKIAKPEMTLTGFEHSKSNLKEKKRLKNLKSEPDTKSESKRSRTHSVPNSDLRNPDSTSQTSSNHYQQTFAIDKADAPPMNQEIKHIESQLDVKLETDLTHDEHVCECERPKERNPANLNPRNYAYMPSCHTSQIKPAGKLINKSMNIKAVISC